MLEELEVIFHFILAHSYIQPVATMLECSSKGRETETGTPFIVSMNKLNNRIN